MSEINGMLLESVIAVGPKGRYLLGQKMASGGQGAVFQAKDTKTGNDAAVKIIEPELFADVGFDVRAEIAIVRSLPHGNITEILDDFEIPSAQTINGMGSTWAYVMPLADESLRDACSRHKVRFTILIACLGAARGLKLLHEAKDGIGSHNDVSPDNILRFGSRWVLSDFGATSILLPEETHRTQFWGKIAYASPEWKLHKHSCPAGDVYSLGVTLHEALTGELPFLDGPWAIPSPLLDRRDVDLVAACLAVKRQDRPSIEYVIAELGGLTAEVNPVDWNVGHVKERESVDLSPTPKPAPEPTSLNASLSALLATRGFQPSRRSQRLFYHSDVNEVRIAFTKTMIRIEIFRDGDHWQLWRSFSAAKSVEEMISNLDEVLAGPFFGPKRKSN